MSRLRFTKCSWSIQDFTDENRLLDTRRVSQCCQQICSHPILLVFLNVVKFVVSQVLANTIVHVVIDMHFDVIVDVFLDVVHESLAKPTGRWSGSWCGPFGRSLSGLRSGGPLWRPGRRFLSRWRCGSLLAFRLLSWSLRRSRSCLRARLCGGLPGLRSLPGDFLQERVNFALNLLLVRLRALDPTWVIQLVHLLRFFHQCLHTADQSDDDEDQ